MCRMAANKVVFVICAIVVGLIGFVRMIAEFSSKPVATNTPATPYSPATVCPDQINNDINYSAETTRYVDVPLHEGCFGAVIRLPKYWKNFFWQPADNQKGFWWAIWITEESKARGPFLAGQLASLHLPTERARFQGHGTLRLYSNDTPPPQAPKGTNLGDVPQQDFAKPRKLSIHDGDPHLCTKPDDAYFPESRPEGRDRVISPVFRFDVKHNDNIVTWAGDFKGTVPVCFTIDSDGMPGNVLFPQLPGHGLEKHITESILTMRYKPAMFKGSPVTVQMEFEITFP